MALITYLTLCRACYDRYQFRGRHVKKNYERYKSSWKCLSLLLVFFWVRRRHFFFSKGTVKGVRMHIHCTNTAICTAHLGQIIHMRPQFIVIAVVHCSGRLSSNEREISHVSAHMHTGRLRHIRIDSIQFTLHILVNVVVGFPLLLLHVHVHCCCWCFFSHYYTSKNLNENCRGAHNWRQDKTRQHKQARERKTHHMIYVYCCHKIICYFVLSDLYFILFLFIFLLLSVKLTISNVIQSWKQNKNKLKLRFFHFI